MTTLKRRIGKLFPPIVHQWKNQSVRFVKGLSYRGDAVYCPICETGYRKFLPWKTTYATQTTRENVVCPGCASHERHRLFHLFFKNETDLYNGGDKRILHFAPEPFLKKILRKLYVKKNYVTTDLMQMGVDVISDITTLEPFEDNSFDIIICVHILEHIPDDRAAMRQLFRVMKQGGWGLIDVPYGNQEKTDEEPVDDPREREKRYGQDDHVRLYALEDFRSRLRETGFELEIIDYNGKFSEEERKRFGLRGKPIHIARKPAR